MLAGPLAWAQEAAPVLSPTRSFEVASEEKLLSSDGGFTLTTDAYSVSGDVLTLHRQLSSVTPDGHIRVMQVPANNFRHTYMCRRQTPGNR
jgi:hypothetical protein